MFMYYCVLLFYYCMFLLLIYICLVLSYFSVLFFFLTKGCLEEIYMHTIIIIFMSLSFLSEDAVTCLFFFLKPMQKYHRQV